MGQLTARRYTGREYQVRDVGFDDFDTAAGYAVATALTIHELVCIITRVRGKVVERIDVTAALSIDTPAE